MTNTKFIVCNLELVGLPEQPMDSLLARALLPAMYNIYLAASDSGMQPLSYAVHNCR